MKELYDAEGQRLPEREAPSPQLLRIYGDLMFLAMRSERHRLMSLGTLQHYLDPPVLLGQYRIFRFDDVPRGAFCWAWLDHHAERRLVRGKPLRAEDWRSGDRLWITDLLAPYRGMSKSIAKFVMSPGNLTDKSFWFRRVRGVNETQRILHVDFQAPRLGRVYSDAEFLDQSRRVR